CWCSPRGSPFSPPPPGPWWRSRSSRPSSSGVRCCPRSATCPRSSVGSTPATWRACGAGSDGPTHTSRVTQPRVAVGHGDRQPTEEGAMTDVLPSWREGRARDAILEFVAAVSDGADAVPPEERVAVFDNDGTLWTEKPMPTQLHYVVEQWAAAAQADPTLGEQQPAKAVRTRE